MSKTKQHSCVGCEWNPKDVRHSEILFKEFHCNLEFFYEKSRQLLFREEKF